MESGYFESACPKFAASHRLDPASGTLLNLGVCYERAGKTASAWATFKEAVPLARRDNRPDRVAFAEEHIKALEPKLSHLTVTVPFEVRVEGLVVRINNVELGRAVWGTPVPTDPGRIIAEVEAPGYRRWAEEIDLRPDGDDKELVIPRLRRAASDEPADPEVPAPSTVSEKDAGVQGTSQATWGYVVGGAGVALVGVGSFFGARALSSWSDRNDHCTSEGCDAVAVQHAEDANRYGTLANVGIGLGLVGVGVGTYLVLTSPAESGSRGGSTRIGPSVAKDGVRMTVGGTF